MRNEPRQSFALFPRRADPWVRIAEPSQGRIQKFIGRRPIAAFGNSDGDLQMLQYVAAAPGPRLAVIVHHTDAEREVAYDRKSSIGRLDKALDEAKAGKWVVIDMKEDWKKVFPFQ